MPTALTREFSKAVERWGLRRLRRVLRLTLKHGVICSSSVWSDGKAG